MYLFFSLAGKRSSGQCCCPEDTCCMYGPSHMDPYTDINTPPYDYYHMMFIDLGDVVELFLQFDQRSFVDLRSLGGASSRNCII